MNNSIPLILKYEDWPRMDRDEWQRLFAGAGLFDDGGSFATWSEPTKQAAQERYGQWLSYVCRKYPDQLAIRPVDRITPDAVRGFIEEGEQRVKPFTIMGWLTNLRTIADAWAPDRDWGWLKRAARHWTQRAGEDGLKPPLPVTASDLLAWSVWRTAEVEEMKDVAPRERALHFRDAIMVGCLIACPVRLRAFTAITLGLHLRRAEESYELHFSASDMKDRRVRVFSITPRLTGPLDRYVDHHRKVIATECSFDRLWLGQSGRPLSKDGLAGRLKSVTHTQLGVALGPHSFRHVAATSIAEYDPEHVGIIRDILGHATLEMANRHYNRASTISSCNRLQDVIGSYNNF